SARPDDPRQARPGMAPPSAGPAGALSTFLHSLALDGPLDRGHLLPQDLQLGLANPHRPGTEPQLALRRRPRCQGLCTRWAELEVPLGPPGQFHLEARHRTAAPVHDAQGLLAALLAEGDRREALRRLQPQGGRREESVEIGCPGVLPVVIVL